MGHWFLFILVVPNKHVKFLIKLILSSGKHPVKRAHTTTNGVLCSTDDRIGGPAASDLRMNIFNLG